MNSSKMVKHQLSKLNGFYWNPSPNGWIIATCPQTLATTTMSAKLCTVHPKRRHPRNDPSCKNYCNNGARNMQGFLFSKPVSPEELRRQLEIPWFYMSQIQEMKLLQTGDSA